MPKHPDVAIEAHGDHSHPSEKHEVRRQVPQSGDTPLQKDLCVGKDMLASVSLGSATNPMEGPMVVGHYRRLHENPTELSRPSFTTS